MAWWKQIKEKIPDHLRQLPAQTSTYFQNADEPSIFKTVELSYKKKETVERTLTTDSESEQDEKGTDSPGVNVHIRKIPVLVSDGEDLILEGWLSKQTILASAVNRTPWINRFFMLKQGCLYYYAIHPSNSVNMEHFLVEDLTNSSLPVQLENTNKIGYRINLRFSYSLYPALSSGEEMNHILMLAALTEVECNSWLTAFKKIESKTSTTEKKEGWLLCRDLKVTHWDLRYFTLDGKTLEYHHRQKKGTFPLTGCELIAKDGFSFGIKAPSGKILNLTADDQEIRDQWMSVIQAATDLLSKKESKVDRNLLDQAHDLIEYCHHVRDMIKDEKVKVDANIKERIENETKRPTVGQDGKYRVLSIDGGGMRGVMNCIILDRLTEHFPDLLSKFQMFVGTSNGGMLAMALAMGFTPNLCRTVLEFGGTKIFARRGTVQIAGTKAKFSGSALKILCDEIYGKHTLGDLPNHVVCPSMLLDNQSADLTKRTCEIRFYHNVERNNEDYCPMMNESCSDVVLRTIAAPTYFPSYQQHVDGGMFAHSPASSALTFVISPTGLGKKLEDVIMISLGTGKVNHYYEDEDHDWGYVQWVPKLTSVLWDGMVDQSEFICKELLGNQYCRFNPTLHTEIPLDDPMQIPVLVETAKKLDLAPLISFIKEHFYPGSSEPENTDEAESENTDEGTS